MWPWHVRRRALATRVARLLNCTRTIAGGIANIQLRHTLSKRKIKTFTLIRSLRCARRVWKPCTYYRARGRDVEHVAHSGRCVSTAPQRFEAVVTCLR